MAQAVRSTKFQHPHPEGSRPFINSEVALVHSPCDSPLRVPLAFWTPIIALIARLDPDGIRLLI